MSGAATKIRALARVAKGATSLGTTSAVAAVGILSGYLGVLTAAALIDGRRPGDGALATNSAEASVRRFAMLVPAHNEGGGIARTLSSFRRLDYPSELFDVHVVADNCTDDTATVVRNAGFSVHERTDSEEPGKGPALNWLYDRLHTMDVEFDTVVVVDADTTLHPGFLRSMASALDSGAQAAQGFYGVRDAGESTAAALRFAALACRHHLRPLGRNAIGGSSGLYGNGMAFDDKLMRDRRWSGHLTEDMEFQMDLLLDGIKVVYVPGAALEAEMPGTLEGATSQNERWELGRIQMARRYMPTLLRRSREGDRDLRAAYIDSALDHIVPPLSVLVALSGLCTAAAFVQSVLRRRHTDRRNLLVSGCSAVIVSAHVLAGLRSVKAPAVVYRSLLRAPQLIIWKIGVWVRVLIRPETVGWTRTKRNTEAH